MRGEQEIFAEMLGLCTSPGYVHALSILYFRDNFIRFGRELKAEDMRHMFSRSRRIRTEITTLVGLLVGEPIDFAHPGLNVLQNYINRTEELLAELHESLAGPMFHGMTGGPAALAGSAAQSDLSGAALREPIFYGGESAYIFQYRDLAIKKYSADDPWLLARMGFDIGDARHVIDAITATQDGKVKIAQRALRSTPREFWTMLPGFVFSAGEIAARANVAVGAVDRVLDAFAFPGGDARAFLP